MEENLQRREWDSPFSVEALHGRVSKLEGWQHGVDEHHVRCNTRLKGIDEKIEAHEKEITSLKEIATELKAINGTLTRIESDIREPVGFYTKYKNGKEVIVLLVLVVVGASSFVAALKYLLPLAARGPV